MLDFFELYLFEDCPYFDETTELLRIEGEGELKIISRERGIAACTEDLAGFYERRRLKVIKYIRSGEEFNAGDVIFQAQGDIKELFKLWRISQTFLSLTCAIATKTRQLVEIARKVNPNVVVATTRKTHPGMRYFELKAVKAGGGFYHRNSLSDSILITQNHLNVVGELKDIKSLRKIEIEPRSREEAYRYAKIADILLLDHFTIEELGELVPKLKALNPRLEIAVAGNIDESNIEDYAKVADIIVTSAPYYARPLDLTTKIKKI
ncbi:nicotinate-nucleotide pyrophosphorylase [Thermococcus sp. M39]|uniref:nicotinate-nucleotide pyrophosphorylase n=1 Tax=unclassified Thermococcus TaxID=2627626 RepID=UPI00143A4250|nr:MULTISPECIES: nicotinate-nucleotide pyrophosphorylase [unclassified Thermococcus]NJE07075.1 nicotinate-nucleotide pyrophosphorylase [Thermococcus sp. M39]NJE13613.1 nicotinate-nucleotide pyrophosphorylase [Thermococcus sp. LS2]